MKKMNSAVMALTFTAALVAGGCRTTATTTATNETATTQVTTETSRLYGEAPLGTGYVSTDEDHDATKNIRSNDNEAAPLGSSYGEFAVDDGRRNVSDAGDDDADDDGVVLGHRMSQKE